VTITNLKIGDSATIVAIDGTDDFANRLADMGLGPHVPIRLIRIAPGGSPYLLKVKDYYISIRREDAARIHLETS
jgi:Fe2+ transport system protein FeoA